MLGGDKTTAPVAGRHVATGDAGRRLRDPSRPDDRPGLRAAACSISAAAPTARISADGRVAGTYVHGLFAGDGFRRAFLAALGAPPSALRYEATVEATLDALAEHLERHVDIDRLLDDRRLVRRRAR